MTDETHAAPSPLDRAADAISVASDFGVVWIAVCVLQVLTRRRGLADAVTRLAAAGFVSLALTRILKHHFGVERDLDDAMARRARTPTSSRFPSGHTLAAFTAAIVLPTSGVGRAAASAFAAKVAWARVRVGHHEPGDVLAAAAPTAAPARTSPARTEPVRRPPTLGGAREERRD